MFSHEIRTELCVFDRQGDGSSFGGSRNENEEQKKTDAIVVTCRVMRGGWIPPKENLFSFCSQRNRFFFYNVGSKTKNNIFVLIIALFDLCS